jgi:hypothetical protein
MLDIDCDHSRIENIDLRDISFAPEILKVNNLANPFSVLRNKESDFKLDNINTLLLIFPLVGYFENETFFLISGIFTFNTIVQTTRGKSLKIQVTCLASKPSSKDVKKLYLMYLAQQITNQLFITDACLVGKLLSAWFKKDKGAKSYLGSKEWLDIFPNINTKEKLASHLSISKKYL